MKSKICTIILFVILFFTSAALKAETYLLDLQKSIEIAKFQSLEMLSLKQDLKIAEYNLRSATSRFKTHIDMDLTAPDYVDEIRPFTDSTGTYYFSNKTSTIGGSLNISQPLPTDGAFYLISGLSNTSYLDDSENYMRVDTRLGFRQPLHALYGYNSIRSAFKIAQLNYENSQKRLKRVELNLVYNVSSSFYRLLSNQKREEIARLNLERQKEAYEIAKNKYDAGLIREVDALQMEVDLAEAQNNFDLSVIEVETAQNLFKELIGIELDDSVVISSEMNYSEVVVDAGKAVDLALQNRNEIRESEIQIEQIKLNIKEQKSYGMVRGNLNAFYNKTGVYNSPMGSALGTAVEQSFSDFQERPGSFGVEVSVNIPIIDWGENKARVQAAEANLQKSLYDQQATLRGIESEVKTLVAGVNSSLKRLQLLEKNVEVAEKSFEITRKRYSDGDIDSQALALERERLNTAYVSHLNAYIQYELNLADLMRKTFYDYKKDMPIN